MVNSPVSIAPCAPRAPFRLGSLAALFACATLAAAGCQQGSRFAEGNGSEIRAYPPIKTEPEATSEPKNPAPPRGDTLATGPKQQAPFTLPPNSRPWRWIVIHHSASSQGGASRFDQQHRANGWDELGYHFVIGNGTDTKDGLVEVGPRWVKQKHGAHAKTPDNRFNEYGIGICLVGNFDSGRPTPRQTKALTSLVAYLMQRYNIPANRVIGHDDTGRSTECPGRNLELQLASIRRAAQQQVALAQRPQGQQRPALYATDQR
jgi:hypothetical protein